MAGSLSVLGGVALLVGAFTLLGALFVGTAAWLDESQNQDRDPWLLDPDRPDAERSERNGMVLEVAFGMAAAGTVASVLGGTLLVAGASGRPA